MAKKIVSNVYLSWPRPDFANVVKTNKEFKAHYQAAIMYAHYELTSADLKKEVLKYLKSLNSKHPLIDRVKEMDEKRFSSIGKYIYVLNHKGDLPDDIMAGLMPSLEKTIADEEARIERINKEKSYLNTSETEKEPQDKMVISIQDRIKEKARETAGEIEGWIDDLYLDANTVVKSVEEFVTLFKTTDMKAPHIRYIQNAFMKRVEEVKEAIAGKDKDLNEGYSYIDKAGLKKIVLFYTNLGKACEMLQEAAKITRAPIKKKPVSQEKVVSKLKFKKEDSTLGIISLNPVQIIGSKELWVYNTKTRKLTQYKCIDERGLGVKGASIENFSTKSIEKTLRKPVETLAEFKKASKVKLRTFLTELSTVDSTPNGKLNENHVILRIDK